MLESRSARVSSEPVRDRLAEVYSNGAVDDGHSITGQPRTVGVDHILRVAASHEQAVSGAAIQFGIVGGLAFRFGVVQMLAFRFGVVQMLAFRFGVVEMLAFRFGVVEMLAFRFGVVRGLPGTWVPLEEAFSGLARPAGFECDPAPTRVASQMSAR